MPGCCAFNCSNSGRSGHKLYRFPSLLKNGVRRKAWIHNIGRDKWTPNDNSRLCEVHFDEDQFENHRADNRRLLKQSAVPTRFSHRPLPKSRKASKYVLQRNSVNSNFVKGSDQVSTDAHRFPDAEENVAPGDLDETMEILELEADRQEIMPDNGSVSVASKMETLESESIPVPQLTENSESLIETTLKESRQEIEDLKRKLNLLQKKFRQKEKDFEILQKNISVLLTHDQIDFLKKVNSSCKKTWSDETIEKALKLYLACHTKGYNYLRDSGHPLPSLRTLQRRIQNFVLKPGISHEVISLLKHKISFMLDEERYVSLMVDEMQIAEGLELDTSTKCIIGSPTIPAANGKNEEVAQHALVFFIGGVSTRWKQVVGYHFSGTSICPVSLKNYVFEVIKNCEDIGLHVDSIVTDMGPHNQAFWRECNLGVKRLKSKELDVKAFCAHPVNNFRKLYAVADAPHILKNLRNHLTQGQIIYLPTDVVEKNHFVSNEVSIQHVNDMMSLEVKNDLKVCPKLTENCLDIGHYDKMKVGPAHVLLSHAVAIGLRHYVELKQLHEDALPTAWFVEMISKWFSIVTSRSKAMSLSTSKTNYKESIDFLKDMIQLMTNLKIGPKGVWKPVQAGFILTTTSMLDLQKLYLNDHKFKFLLLSRFSQDAIENLFSTIRLKNPVPNCKEFKTCLRMVILTQYFTSGVKGNAFSDPDEQTGSSILQLHSENPHFEFDVDFEKPDAYALNKTYTEKISFDIDFGKDSVEMVSEIVEKDLPENENYSLFYLCGCIAKVLLKRKTLCSTCIDILQEETNDTNFSKEMFTKLKEFVKDQKSLTYVKEGVYQRLLHVENLFRANEERILKGELDSGTLKMLILSSAENHFDEYPLCCNLLEKLINTYVSHRIYFLIRKKNKSIESNKRKRCSSKSIGMRAAAAEIK